VLVSCLRYFCHVISGATVWAGLSIPTEAALVYSIGYNATYMLPEAIVLCAVAYYLGSVLFFGEGELRRMSAVTRAPRGVGALTALAGFLGLGGLVFDTVMVFSRLQNAETGEFTLQNLPAFSFESGFWLAIVIVSGVALLGACLLLWWRARVVHRTSAQDQ
jgi:thiamine transporter